MSILELAKAWALPTTLICFPLYVVLLYIYRVTLHPLARFPGPRLAAITFWFEFYHDGVRGGQYLFRIKEMHAKYGPIVRISPDELHVNDPSFLPELMPAGKHRRDKYPRLIQLFGFSQATGATADHDLHRTRRGAMSKMFSKESVRRLEPIMRTTLDKLLFRLKGFQESGEEIDIKSMYGAFTNDVITQYAYGFSMNWMEAPRFNESFFKMLDGFHDFGPFAVQFWWFMPLVFRLPKSVLLKINPGFEAFVRFKLQLLSNIARVMKSHNESKDRTTVFDEILDSRLSAEDKEPLRLLQEAQNVSIAGTETTAWILSIMTVHILSTPRVLAKLRNELKEAIPDPDQPLLVKDIEQLPYLGAVISEGFRLAMGTSQRQTRINPEGVMTFNDGKKQWHIPPGTPVGMAAPLIHLNPNVFENPNEFRPERFLENPKLKRYIMTFSQGSRQCLGMQLATTELFVMHSEIWRRFGSKDDHGSDGWWELYETDRSDTDMVSDRFLPYPRADNRLSSGSKVYLPSDSNYTQEATQRWNAFSAPSYIVSVKPATEEDIQIIIRYASYHQIPFLGTGGGHGYSASLVTLDHGIEVDLGHFDTVSINKTASTMTIGGSVHFANVTGSLYDAGKEIRMVGASLGGGVGPYGGLHGLQLDALRSVRMITGTGSLIQVSATQHPELWWGMRGAGFNFGIVTSATYTVYDFTNGGQAMNADFRFHVNQSRSVYDYVKSFEGRQPDAFSIGVAIAYEETFGGTYLYANLIYVGPLSEGTRLVQPLIDLNPFAQVIIEVPWKDIETTGRFGVDKFACIKGGLHSVWGLNLYQIDAPTLLKAVSYMDSVYRKYPEFRKTFLALDMYANRVIKSVPDNATSYPYRSAVATILIAVSFTNTSSGHDANEVGRLGREIFIPASGASSKNIEVYVHYAHGNEGEAGWYSERKLPRLRALKKRYDPHALFTYYNAVGRSYDVK